MYEATFEVKWLVEAKKLSREMIELFGDTQSGGFFLTGNDGEKLIARSKPNFDGALPSGNSIAAMALLKLGKLTMDQYFTQQTDRTIKAFSYVLERAPAQLTAMVSALDFWLGPSQEIVIAGNMDDVETKQMLKLVRSYYLPNAVILLHESGDRGLAIEENIPFVKNQMSINGRATAYVCENYICKRPVNTIEELVEILNDISKKK